MPYDAVARRRNLRHRTHDADGNLVSTIIPKHLHGRPSGYILYGCLCESCKDWRRRYVAELAERREFNQRIIRQLFHGNGRAPLPAPPKIEEERPAPVVEAQEPKRLNGFPDKIWPREIPKPELKAPPVTPGVRERITDVATVAAISKAYFQPDWVAVLDDDRERRVHGDMEIVVGMNGHEKPVLFFRKREEVGTGDSEILQQAKKGVPKAKGGRGGSQGPSDYRGLIERLKATGCTVEFTGGGHMKVAKNGRSVTLPSTASDWRSLKNSIAQAKREGLLG